MKTLIIILFILFFSPFCYASTISISPTNLEFKGKINEEICREVFIKIDKLETLIITDRWAQKEVAEKLLHLYTQNHEKFKLNLQYPKEIDVDLEEKIKICLTGTSPGKYQGAMLYRIKDKPIQIGIWLEVNLEGNESLKITGQPITGQSIIENDSNFKKGGFVFLILGTILTGLFIIEKKLRK